MKTEKATDRVLINEEVDSEVVPLEDTGESHTKKEK
jgi:hypothetical protein